MILAPAFVTAALVPRGYNVMGKKRRSKWDALCEENETTLQEIKDNYGVGILITAAILAIILSCFIGIGIAYLVFLIAGIPFTFGRGLLFWILFCAIRYGFRKLRPADE